MNPIIVSLELSVAQDLYNIIRNSVQTLTHVQWKQQFEPVLARFEMSINKAINDFQNKEANDNSDK